VGADTVRPRGIVIEPLGSYRREWTWRNVKIGVRVPCYKRWADRSTVRDIAQTAEDLGFDSLWVQDHLVLPVGATVEGVSTSLAGAPQGPVTAAEYYGADDWWLDPYATWGFLSGVTSKVTLASDIVVVPYRNPIVQAKMLGTLDVLSGGRMLLGTGSGHVRRESEVLAANYDARGEIHDEYLTVIKALLSSDDVSFTGKYYSFENVRPLVQPVQKPHPPIYIGGNARRSIRRAALLGDGWLPNMPSPQGLRDGIKQLEDACRAIGRTDRPAVAVSVPSGIRLPDPDSDRDRSNVDPVQAAIDLVVGYRDAGADHLSIALPMRTAGRYLRQIQLFAREVLPTR